jgi:hypothetical protein
VPIVAYGDWFADGRFELARLRADGVLVILVVGLLLVVPAGAAAAVWTIVQAQSPCGGLFDVTRVPGHSTLWAVGGCAVASGSRRPEVEHRTLAGLWEHVPVPRPAGSLDDELYGVAAVSPSDVWAVGIAIQTVSGRTLTLIERWDGAHWAQVPSPNPAGGKFGYNLLQAVAVTSSTSVWAVGYSDTGRGHLRTLVEHWNGSTWAIVPTPNANRRNNYLNSVATVPGTGHVWAFGAHRTSTSTNHTLVLHLGARGWTVDPTPNPFRDDVFTDGTVIHTGASNTVWAVGNHLVERRTPSGWHFVPVPNPGDRLQGVAQIPGTDHLWAVGDHQPGGALTERWNGHAWRVIPNPAIRGGLFAVTALSRTNAWAVGANLALIEQYH